MAKSNNISELLKAIRDDYAYLENYTQDLLQKIEAIATRQNNSEVLELLFARKESVNEKIEELDKKSDKVYSDIQEKINLLVKKNETVISDNYLLEYKKKDLLLLANNLEEAYEEISEKNKELQHQKVQIASQADKIKIVHQELLNKNTELEQQKGFIMDQADYLHEANEAISNMHKEVEQQKDEILNKNQELVSLNNEKNNLIGIVAHDLKSPLNQIKGLISLVKLTADNMGKDTQNYIQIIEGSAHRLSEMIEKILDVEAIDSKSLNLQIEPIKLDELLSKIGDNFKIEADSKNITLHYAVKGKDIQADLDESYTNQIFENLISNAIKFSPHNRNIYINIYNEKDKVVCEVKDEGPGISASDQKKLFGKYQKLSAQPTGNETSTGLGLSIVKKYVEAMNGRIWCESEEGAGSSFLVSFEKKSELSSTV